MFAEIIDKIVSLKETKIFEIDGQTYSDANLTRIPPHVDRPDSVSVSGLDAVCKLVRTEIAKVGTTIMVHVRDYNKVEVMTTYLTDFSRNVLYRAQADAPGMRTGWRDRETALIELRSLFIPNGGTEHLLDLLSRMSDENTVSTNDNGVTQTVTARQGVALNAVVNVRPRIKLQPFRTFSRSRSRKANSSCAWTARKALPFSRRMAASGVWKRNATSLSISSAA